MKQIAITPEITELIKKAVGPDVDQTNFAVFESISLNTLPLPGKEGTLFERAEVSYLTLRQMADWINSGKHLPFISNHQEDSVPHGRVFNAATFLLNDGTAEFRTLFYVDATPDGIQLRDKLNAGSLDEVSVSFLASQILCSECDFDYRGDDATFENLISRTCTNGHEVGTDGVHVRLIGVAAFTELSAVTNGAADNAKIVGKSQSKLAAPVQHLAAKGFEVDKLYLSASRGEHKVDIDKLVTDLTNSKAEVITLNASKTSLEGKVTTLETEKTELSGRITTLEGELQTAKDGSKQTELDEAKTQLSEAKTVLGDLYTRLATAAGEKDIKVPDSIAEIKAGIEKHQSKLTAVLPIGGVSTDGKNDGGDTGQKFSADRAAAFKSNR